MAVFNQPQRQSPVGIIVMFFDTLQQYARALWPVLVVWALRADRLAWLWVLLTIGSALLLTALTAYLKYRNFTFFIDEEAREFVLTEGVLNKTRTSIGFKKIQQVNISQSLLQRLIGVHALEIDTAGTGKSEAKIKAVSHEMALALKQRLIEGQQTETQEEVSETDGTTATSEPLQNQQAPVLTIGLATLAKVGLTSNYVRSLGVLVAFFFTVYENFLRLSNQGYVSSDAVENYISRGLAVKSLLFLLLFLFGVILLVNLVRTVTRYFGYEIKKDRGSLLLSFGLFNTKSTVLRPERVQTIAITQNYFQKKLNLSEFKIKQAGSSTEESKKSAVEIPGCNAIERDAILELLLGFLPQNGHEIKPNFRKLVFAIFLSIVLPLGVFFTIASQAQENLMQWAYVAPFYTVFVLILLYFGFRNYRLFVTNNVIIKQSGAWDITREILTPGKIQALSVSQLFWHKSVNIGYLTIHTAAGDVRFELGDFTVIQHYVNLWLYDMERGDGNWM